MNKSAFLFLLVALLNGCAANPFRKFYVDQTNGVDVTRAPGFILPTTEPRVVHGTNPETDSLTMAEDNYLLLGYSSFNGPSENPMRTISQAKELHAEVVLVYSKYTNTESGAIPLVLPTSSTTYSSASATAYGSGGWATAYGTGTSTTYGSQTTYIPYSVDHYDQSAQFWIRATPPVFGARVSDLSELKKREIASNRGVEISVVIRGSPAFNSDFLRGDVIKKIDDTDINIIDDYFAVIGKSAGKTVTIELIRDGKSITKTVTLRAKPA